MSNVFQRTVDVQSLKDVAVGDMTPQELTAYLTTAYPYDPLGALDYLVEKHEVGYLLSSRTKVILEGLKNVKGKKHNH